MKYEMIFGDEKLFDGAPEECILAVRMPGGDPIFYLEKNKSELRGNVAILKYGFIKLAMRHIIKAPTWTKADQEKGILPTVGCLCIEGMYPEEVIAVTSKYIVTKTKTDGVCTTSIETFKRTYRPIETPREKYDRERDECINKLISELPRRPVSQKHILNSLYEELKPFTGGDHD